LDKAILVEILGGLAVLLGALVPLASIPMAAVLLVAVINRASPYGFSSITLTMTNLLNLTHTTFHQAG